MNTRAFSLLLVLFIIFGVTLSACSSSSEKNPDEIIEENLNEEIADVKTYEGESGYEDEDVNEDALMEGNDNDGEDIDTNADENDSLKDTSSINTTANNGSDSSKSSIKPYSLESYSLPEVFSMKKPKGWKVYKAGEYNTIAFLSRDEKEPLRQLFCFSEIGLFYIDKTQKDLEINYQNNDGYEIPWLDMPVIDPFDGTTFFNNFNSIMKSNIAADFLAAGNMPKPAGFEKIEIISQEAIDEILPGFPAVLVRALLVQNGKPAQGLFVVSGVPDGYGHATALLVTGITAPMREFGTVQASLLESVRSFVMDESYVANGVSTIQENGERFRQISQTISETSDIITKGYTERNKNLDITIEKRSDQILGVERVYDPDNEVVYEVQNGFYDYYQSHRDEYTKKNLQPMPDNDPAPWGKAPVLNHGLVIP